MTNKQCEVCKYRPIGYSDSPEDPVWSCGMMDDPRMPFDMEDDTPCPCFEADPEDDHEN